MDARRDRGLAPAVRAEVERWQVQDSALAACALDLARRLSEPGVRPAAAAMLHKELRSALVELAAQATPQRAADPVDELQARRERRRRMA